MQFKAGDVIKRPGPWGTDHLGLFAFVDVYGRQWVIHNAKNECVRWDLLESFADGKPVFLVRKATSASEGAAIVVRAQSLLGRTFDLVHFNCEHFVFRALTGKATSPQLHGMAAGLAVIAAFGLLASSSNA